MSRNFVLLIILSSIWGSAFFAIKVCVGSLNPITVASGRLLIASLVLYLYFKIKKLKFKASYKTILIIALIGFIGNLIPFFLISWSEIYLQSNTVGLLMSVGPIFALILSHLMTKDDKFSLQKLFAIITGLIGVLFIFGYDSLTAIFSSDFLLIMPKLTVIMAVLGYVLSSILAYNLKNIDTLTLTTFVTLSAALISIPFMFFIEFTNHSQPTFKSLISLLYLGVFPTALAFLIRFHLILKAGPTFLSYVSYLIPGFAILWGYVFLKENISINMLIGLVFVLVGIYFSQKYSIIKNN